MSPNEHNLHIVTSVWFNEQSGYKHFLSCKVWNYSINVENKFALMFNFLTPVLMLNSLWEEIIVCPKISCSKMFLFATSETTVGLSLPIQGVSKNLTRIWRTVHCCFAV